MGLAANWMLATFPVIFWFYFLSLLRYSSWEGQPIYFFTACVASLLVAFAGIFRLTRGCALASRLALSSLWLVVLIPAFLFLAFSAAIDGATVMP